MAVCCVAYVGGGLGFAVRQVKTRASFAMPFYTTKLAILSPRQARDKHRENSPTKEIDASNSEALLQR
jgi:hypothetical protein